MLSSIQQRQLDLRYNYEHIFPGEIRVAFGKRCGYAYFTTKASSEKELIKLCGNKIAVKEIEVEIKAIEESLLSAWKEIYNV
jgi:hypothetical protein